MRLSECKWSRKRGRVSDGDDDEHEDDNHTNTNNDEESINNIQLDDHDDVDEGGSAMN